MPRRRRRRPAGAFMPNGQTVIVNHDRNEKFVFRKTQTWLDRHLGRYFVPDDETMEIVCWIAGTDMDTIGNFLLPYFDGEQQREYRNDLREHALDPDCYGMSLGEMARRLKAGEVKKFLVFLRKLLRDRAGALKYRGKSDIEKNIDHLGRLFGLDDIETEVCAFLFINAVYDKPESFFQNHLNCNKFTGRKYLLHLLDIASGDFNRMLSGALIKSGIVKVDKYDVELDDAFITFIQNPTQAHVSDQFYKPVARTDVPLEQHFIDESEIRFMRDLLKRKPSTSTHLLLYGPPGTGKTTLARRLAQDLGAPAYEIVRDEKNTTANRRAALIACINMTNERGGSLIIVDEADNVLNTDFSWFMRGETQDKGWLNEMLETSGLRVIWIANRICGIDKSVLRRFAYSHQFKPFSRRQRTRLWENILRRNKCASLVDADEIDALSRKYHVSAGGIDLAVRKAREIAPRSAVHFRKTVHIALNSHHILLNDGEKPANSETIETNYSLDGLNVSGDLDRMLAQLARFDRHLRSGETRDIRNMNILFHGPPGTGKSELARHIGERLEREVMCKRLGDILDPYVGMTERHIKQAFEMAESEESILVVDEADSLLFNRERAVRSWEASMTNEFLTRMDRFKGILICTTNMMKGMDKASIRRFNHKIRFDYLKPDGALIFYDRFLTPLAGAPLPVEWADVLKTETTLAPGDFKTVRDQFAYCPKNEIDHRLLVDALREEARIKDDMEGRRKLGF